jgi:hypothetical protein
VGPHIGSSTRNASGHYVIYGGYLVSPQIFNNLAIGGVNEAHIGTGYINCGGRNDLVPEPINCQIYNNTIYTLSSANNPLIEFSDAATGNVVRNNIIYAPFFTSSAATILLTSGSTITSCDHNDFYVNSGNPYFGNYDLHGWTAIPMSTFMSETGCDPTSTDITTNPIISGNYQIDAASPTRGTGTVTGQLSTTDAAGVPWANPPSMGAYEYTGASDTTPPAAPSGLNVQ